MFSKYGPVTQVEEGPANGEEMQVKHTDPWQWGPKPVLKLNPVLTRAPIDLPLNPQSWLHPLWSTTTTQIFFGVNILLRLFHSGIEEHGDCFVSQHTAVTVTPLNNFFFHYHLETPRCQLTKANRTSSNKSETSCPAIMPCAGQNKTKKNKNQNPGSVEETWQQCQCNHELS